MRKFEEKMINISQEHEQNKQMILRYDEVLSQKANKLALEAIQDKVEEEYLRGEELLYQNK